MNGTSKFVCSGGLRQKVLLEEKGVRRGNLWGGNRLLDLAVRTLLLEARREGREGNQVKFGTSSSVIPPQKGYSLLQPRPFYVQRLQDC